MLTWGCRCVDALARIVLVAMIANRITVAVLVVVVAVSVIPEVSLSTWITVLIEIARMSRVEPKKLKNVSTFCVIKAQF